MTSTPPARRPPRPVRRDRHPAAETGRVGEQVAADHLAAAGLEVVCRNWRIAEGDLRGELDVVALDHDQRVVVVVEVKSRRGAGYGGGLAAVTVRKQAKIRRLAVAFLLAADLPYRHVRFDVVEVRLDLVPPRVFHLEQAF